MDPGFPIRTPCSDSRRVYAPYTCVSISLENLKLGHRLPYLLLTANFFFLSIPEALSYMDPPAMVVLSMNLSQ